MAVKPLDTARIEELAASGLAQYQIAQSLGISWDTWAKRRDDPETGVSEALKRGEQAAIGVIENALYKSAAEGNLGA
jgi:hypothetical protein